MECSIVGQKKKKKRKEKILVLRVLCDGVTILYFWRDLVRFCNNYTEQLSRCLYKNAVL